MTRPLYYGAPGEAYWRVVRRWHERLTMPLDADGRQGLLWDLLAADAVEKVK